MYHWLFLSFFFFCDPSGWHKNNIPSRERHKDQLSLLLVGLILADFVAI